MLCSYQALNFEFSSSINNYFNQLLLLLMEKRMPFLIEKWVNRHAMPADLKIYIILQLSCKPAVFFEVSLPPFCFLLFFITMYSVANKKSNDEDFTSEHKRNFIFPVAKKKLCRTMLPWSNHDCSDLNTWHSKTSFWYYCFQINLYFD